MGEGIEVGMVTVSLVVLMQAVMASQVFDFEDEKGINHVLVILDAPLEFISGKGEGLSGLVSYDPEARRPPKGRYNCRWIRLS